MVVDCGLYAKFKTLLFLETKWCWPLYVPWGFVLPPPRILCNIFVPWEEKSSEKREDFFKFFFLQSQISSAVDWLWEDRLLEDVLIEGGVDILVGQGDCICQGGAVLGIIYFLAGRGSRYHGRYKLPKKYTNLRNLYCLNRWTDTWE